LWEKEGGEGEGMGMEEGVVTGYGGEVKGERPTLEGVSLILVA